MDRDVVALRAKALGQRDSGPFRQADVEDAFASVAIKMAMFLHVRAEPSGAAFEGDLAGQPALDQGIQAIIHRRHRYVRHLTLGANKHFLSGRMISLLQKHSINVLALGRKTKTARRQTFIQMAV